MTLTLGLGAATISLAEDGERYERRNGGGTHLNRAAPDNRGANFFFGVAGSSSGGHMGVELGIDRFREGNVMGLSVQGATEPGFEKGSVGVAGRLENLTFLDSCETQQGQALCANGVFNATGRVAGSPSGMRGAHIYVDAGGQGGWQMRRGRDLYSVKLGLHPLSAQAYQMHVGEDTVEGETAYGDVTGGNFGPAASLVAVMDTPQLQAMLRVAETLSMSTFYDDKDHWNYTMNADAEVRYRVGKTPLSVFVNGGVLWDHVECRNGSTACDVDITLADNQTSAPQNDGEHRDNIDYRYGAGVSVAW